MLAMFFFSSFSNSLILLTALFLVSRSFFPFFDRKLISNELSLRYRTSYFFFFFFPPLRDIL